MNPKCKEGKCLLVYCGAMSHIITEKEMFFRPEGDVNPKNHAMELANGSRATGVVQGWGDARGKLHNKKGRSFKITLKDALNVPSYKRIIV